MPVDLIEDIQGWRWRFHQSRILGFGCIRTCLIYGPLPSIITALVLGLYLEQPLWLCMHAALVPLTLSILMLLLPYGERFQPRRRWRLTNERLQTGGFFKNLSWISIHSYSTRRLLELPGCYLLEVRGKDVRQASDLVLSEATMTPAAAEALVAEHPTFRFI